VKVSATTFLFAFFLLASGSALAAETPCQNNKAGEFPCNEVSLLAHLSLTELGGTGATAGNDIWGFMDRNNGREYALVGLMDGIAIVEVTQADQAHVVSTIKAPQARSIWRDIKVYQSWSESLQRWQAYAYVVTEAAQAMQIIDLNDLPASARVARISPFVFSSHDIYISNIDYATGTALPGRDAWLYAVPSGFAPTFTRTRIFDLTDPTSPQPVGPGLADGSKAAARQKHAHDGTTAPTHDLASMILSGTRAAACPSGADPCEVVFSFSGDFLRLWDVSDKTQPQKISTTSYPKLGFVHSGWPTQDGRFLFVQDELDEEQFGLNTTLRVFSIEDIHLPQLAGTWTGPTHAIDHNGFVRGSRYFMSNYRRGLTVLDISQPATPSQLAYFDTFPADDDADFDGAWGVYPFLPSGNIVVSDINSGLFVLRPDTPADRLDVPGALAGSWFDPGHNGEGMLLDVSAPHSLFLAWFTYDQQGGQQWLTASTENFQGFGKPVTLELRRSHGGIFGPTFDPAAVSSERWGDLTLDFADCGHFSAAYHSELGFGDATLAMQRLVASGVNGADCATAVQPVAADFNSGELSGAWFDPSHDGEGLLLDFFADDGVFVTWFTFDDQGEPMWLTALSRDFQGLGSTTQFTVNRWSGPHFGHGFDPANLQAQDWGNMSLRFDDCGTAHLSYQSSQGFGDGTLDLRRISAGLAGFPCQP